MKAIVFLSLLLLFVAGACGGSSQRTPTPADTATPSASPAEPSVEAPQGRMSAKQAFSIAAPYARAGNAGAQLASIRLEERHPQTNDGRGSAWSLLFVSSEGESVRLYVIGGQLFLDSAADIPVAGREPSEVWSPDPDPWDPVGEWVDSTEAIKDALAHSTMPNVYDMALGSISWVFRFFDTCNAPAIRVAVGAATGKFMAQHAGEWYRCP